MRRALRGGYRAMDVIWRASHGGACGGYRVAGILRGSVLGVGFG